MTVKEIAELIEDKAPLSLAAEYDNSGMVVETHNDEVDKIVVALDMTAEVIEKAVSENANLIVTHHPIIFSPIKKLKLDVGVTSLVMKAVKNNIAVYSAHTNFDNCSGGITDAIMDALGAYEREALEEDGCGRVGNVGNRKLSDIVRSLAEFTGSSSLRVSGEKDRRIRRIAVINGAGGRDESIIDVLRKKHVELFVTGETKHSLALELKANGIAFIDVEHYCAERVFVRLMSAVLKKSGAEIIEFEETNPYEA